MNHLLSYALGVIVTSLAGYAFACVTRRLLVISLYQITGLTGLLFGYYSGSIGVSLACGAAAFVVTAILFKLKPGQFRGERLPAPKVNPVVEEEEATFLLRVLDSALDIKAEFPHATIAAQQGDLCALTTTVNIQGTLKRLDQLETEGKLAEPSAKQVKRLEKLLEKKP